MTAMSSAPDEFSSPFFLLVSWQDCWVCGSSCRVAGLASAPQPANAWEKPEPYLLSNIELMPEEFLAALRKVQPQYEFRASNMAGTSYFMNTCARCGAHSGDYYLHSQPGGAFFPMTDEDEAAIEVHELPFVGSFRFKCAAAQGNGAGILAHGKRSQFSGGR